MTRRILISLVCFPVSLLLSLSCFADWELKSDQSSLQFVTTKATHVAEVQKFTRLSGNIDKAGQAVLEIDLTSVDTSIEIRDQRMRDMLFETNLYPKATLTTQVGVDKLKLKPGEESKVELSGILSIHGISHPVTSVAIVSMSFNGDVIAESQSPIILNATNIGLVEGIEKLREVAGLPNISYSVAVSYRLRFEQGK